MNLLTVTLKGLIKSQGHRSRQIFQKVKLLLYFGYSFTLRLHVLRQCTTLQESFIILNDIVDPDLEQRSRSQVKVKCKKKNHQILACLKYILTSIMSEITGNLITVLNCCMLALKLKCLCMFLSVCAVFMSEGLILPRK